MHETRPTAYTFKLSAGQQEAVGRELRVGNYVPVEVPFARTAAERPDCRIVLYLSGKLVVQGRGAADWVQFVLEPQVLGDIVSGYEEERHPEAFRPHMGIDESGKGDFFGPMVIAAAYVDADLARAFQRMKVRDSKTITSDRKALDMGRELRGMLGGRFALVTVGPRAYNRLYASMGNVNRLLAWGHARAIENLLDRVPDCGRAVADQFGPERQIRQALLKKGRRIALEQRPRAESDPAVAAASILARCGFLEALEGLGKQYGRPFPKGASAAVREAAVDLVRARGPGVLLETAKCHFRTADQVLAGAGSSREALGPDGQAVSRTTRFVRRGKRAPGTGQQEDPS